MITVHRCQVYAMLCFPLTVSLAVADVNPPSDLIYEEVGNQVELSWTNNDFYDIIEIHLDGNLFAAVPGSESGVISATPAPYTQPPYPPAGSTCTRTNIVVANAP